MAIVSHKRSDFVENASAKASTGWNRCMGKPMCKWPAILGILLAILVLLTCTYFLLRCLSCCCCDCLSGGRYQRGGRKRKHKYADLHSSPYDNNTTTAYQTPLPPPGYPTGQQPPPQYVQFERPRGEDSLPAMPSWKEAQERKVYDQEHDRLRKDVEMGDLAAEREKEYEQRQPMLATAEKRSRDPVPGYVEMDGSQAGDLGRAAGYRPYGQAYTAYSPVADKGNSWRNV